MATTTTVTLAPIREVEQILDATENGNKKQYKSKFSVESANVQMQDGSSQFSLNDFYNNWKDFKQNGSFFYHGTSTPGDGKREIKLWYNPSY